MDPSAQAATPSRGVVVARLAMVLVLILSLVGRPGAASSQRSDEAADDSEIDLDQTRQRLETAAAELDLLNDSDAELEARLAGLEADIVAQAGEVEARRAAVDAAAARAAELEAAVAAAQATADEQLVLLQKRAVAAYIDPAAEGLAILLESDDYNEFHKRNVLVRQVGEYDRDLLDAYLEAEEQLSVEKGEAAEARARAAELQEEAEQALASLETAEEEELVVRRVLRVRIASFESEVDALSAEEDKLMALLAARQAETEQAPPPTTATTATTAPPSTDPPVGPTTTAPGGSSSTTTTTITPTTSPPTTVPGGPSFVWPTSGTLTSPFGMRWGKMHQGIDIAASTGTPVVASSGGEVFFAGWLGGYGNAVLIDHGGGYTTLYAHNSELLVTEGQQVAAGETVALIGSTGNSTGPHVHFELRLWGTAQDPLAYLP